MSTEAVDPGHKSQQPRGEIPDTVDKLVRRIPRWRGTGKRLKSLGE